MKVQQQVPVLFIFCLRKAHARNVGLIVGAGDINKAETLDVFSTWNLLSGL
jgi:hypothetical protein